MKTILIAAASVLSFVFGSSSYATDYYCNGQGKEYGSTRYYANGQGINYGSTLYYPNGQGINYGSTLYYPNGQGINYGSTLYYPNGQGINYGSTLYYPNGQGINYGSTCYYENGSQMGTCPKFVKVTADVKVGTVKLRVNLGNAERALDDEMEFTFPGDTYTQSFTVYSASVKVGDVDTVCSGQGSGNLQEFLNSYKSLSTTEKQAAKKEICGG